MAELRGADVNSLFRPEFRQREPRLEGAVILSCPVSIWAPAFLLGGIGAIALMFAAFAQYAVKIPAAGVILPDTGIETVYAPAGGAVTAIYAAEGDHVDAGARLLTIAARDGGTTDVLAPVAGRIIALGAAPRGRAAPGDTLMMILPDGATLQAVLTAPAAAVANVRPGQDVLLTWPGMGARATVRGAVAGVATVAISLEPAAGAAPGPVRRIVVTLAEGGETPAPGMPVSAQIVQERRSVLGWIFEPVASALRRIRGGADA